MSTTFEKSAQLSSYNLILNMKFSKILSFFTVACYVKCGLLVCVTLIFTMSCRNVDARPAGYWHL